jgi:predicted ATPase
MSTDALQEPKSKNDPNSRRAIPVRRFILTGTPGSGKTALLRQLETDGFSVVEEAATDVIALSQAQGVAEPWTQPSFIDAVVDLQRRRGMRTALERFDLQFHDRSVVCTAALANYLAFPISEMLQRELERVQSKNIFQKQVFFVRNLGCIAPTEARRISYEESLRFETIHERVYRERGYELIFVEPGTLADRVAAIHRAIQA